METTLLHDLQVANQTITQFVSEVSAAKASVRSEWPILPLDPLVAQLNKLDGSLQHLPPPDLRGEEVSAELRKYEVNLALLKSTIQDLGPVLEERRRSVTQSLAQLGAAGAWSKSLLGLSD